MPLKVRPYTQQLGKESAVQIAVALLGKSD